ncbi:hypothetical protein [Arthrobacter sp. NPDC056727]|uniref:hypothetical protein n=1 Tax=Arthrobacter sp. NPDC056727 TaxID=3345927 RepID=UPI0036732CBA
MTKRREAAPHPERARMYRSGLTRGQITKLVGAATSSVGGHWAAAGAAHPRLQSAHEAAAALKTAQTAPALAYRDGLKTLSVWQTPAGS